MAYSQNYIFSDTGQQGSASLSNTLASLLAQPAVSESQYQQLQAQNQYLTQALNQYSQLVNQYKTQITQQQNELVAFTTVHLELKTERLKNKNLEEALQNERAQNSKLAEEVQNANLRLQNVQKKEEEIQFREAEINRKEEELKKKESMITKKEEANLFLQQFKIPEETNSTSEFSPTIKFSFNTTDNKHKLLPMFNTLSPTEKTNNPESSPEPMTTNINDNQNDDHPHDLIHKALITSIPQSSASNNKHQIIEKMNRIIRPIRVRMFGTQYWAFFNPESNRQPSQMVADLKNDFPNFVWLVKDNLFFCDRCNCMYNSAGKCNITLTPLSPPRDSPDKSPELQSSSTGSVDRSRSNSRERVPAKPANNNNNNVKKCRYYFGSGCFKGNSCQFSHEDDGRGRDRGRDRGRSRSRSRSRSHSRHRRRF